MGSLFSRCLNIIHCGVMASQIFLRGVVDVSVPVLGCTPNYKKIISGGKAPKGRNTLAQGVALCVTLAKKNIALKGRNIVI
jgi:hypothetical protein